MTQVVHPPQSNQNRLPALAVFLSGFYFPLSLLTKDRSQQKENR